MNTINWRAHVEAAKEIARWALLFITSWVIIETLKQVQLVPEVYILRVYVFTYLIPARLLFTMALTFLGRYVDKYLFIADKERIQIREEIMKDGLTEDPKGLLQF